MRTLTLQLTDIDLSGVWDSKRQTRSNVWTSYQEELLKLDDALLALPSVAELIVAPPKSSRSQLLRGLYLSFLAMIPRRYPKLEYLSLDDDEAVLDQVPGL